MYRPGGLLIALIPVATVAAAHFLVEGERFNPRSIPGLVISLVGTGILVGWGARPLKESAIFREVSA